MAIKKNSIPIYMKQFQVNDILFSSNNFINKYGLESNLKTILKNVNSEGKNSSKFKEKAQSEILSMLIYDASLPMIKNHKNLNNFLTPNVSLRYSPNDSKI